MTRLLLALALLVASPAYAQLVFTATPPTNSQPLQGATLNGLVHIQLAQLTGGPCDFSIDGIAHKRELGAPYVFSNESGNQADNVLWNTSTTPDGSHMIIAQCASPAAPVMATFTIANVTPQPPNPTPIADTITWTPSITNNDGSTLTDLAGYRIYTGTTRVATVGPTVTSWQYTASGTYYLTAFTIAGAESLNSNSVTVTLAPPVTPVDCTVSAWMSGTPGPWLPTVCATGTQSRDTPQSRVVVIPASNGGLACPALTQSISEQQACAVPPPVDVCKADPLTAKVTAWQGGTSGARSLSYTTNKSIVGLVEIMVPPKVTFTDSRGCSVSVTR